MAASRSAPVSRTQRNIATPISAVGMPRSTAVSRHPSSRRSHGPASAAKTEPTLPPEMWALIANPRRSGGNCSERRPFPTGCCGDPPTRERIVVSAKAANDGTAARLANPSPNSSCPAVRIGRRATRRVTKA